MSNCINSRSCSAAIDKSKRMESYLTVGEKVSSQSIPFVCAYLFAHKRDLYQGPVGASFIRNTHLHLMSLAVLVSQTMSMIYETIILNLFLFSIFLSLLFLRLFFLENNCLFLGINVMFEVGKSSMFLSGIIYIPFIFIRLRYNTNVSDGGGYIQVLHMQTHPFVRSPPPVHSFL